MPEHNSNILKVKGIGIDTYRENTIYMRADCPVSLSEGFTALTRVAVHYYGNRIIATLNVVESALLNHDEAGLSSEAMKRLNVKDGDIITITHLKNIESLSKVRAKIYGRELSHEDFSEIIADVVSGHYSNIELAAFITACSGNHLTVTEIISLTKAMVSSGKKIEWAHDIILDKHSVGGLPGNRTTPIVISIVAAAGLIIPKTSSYAITSPAGTADMMQTITPVNLSIDEIKKVIEKENGCIVWGGGVKLSPADDILIAIEKALDIDSEGQMVASVLSKKVAAGATHVVIDIPVGPTAKVRSQEEALKLQYYFKAVAQVIGLSIETVITDGRQPIGRGIGPSLEAADVLSVLRNEKGQPVDLKEKSVQLAGALLELSGKHPKGTGSNVALAILEDGRALKKFISICEAQGGFREPTLSNYTFDVTAKSTGTMMAIDNRKLARIAKLAGAPQHPSAGIKFFAALGKKINKGDTLFTIHASAIGELEYAKEYLDNVRGLYFIE